ncbi:TRAP transporter large permease subunit [Paracoccus hibiscisoli]|uniref:TRAP transporter large permease subunit n=1 Tax=Paracoccus hibiscisoli TaxID=2023261 RepID=A0A4U0QTZ5_9RHOB|nr:TRAP transporter large permease subunit [Paracoccus hibiscisoli]
MNIASAPTGMLIPPLMAVIIYLPIAGGASISALFLGGAVAGSLWGIRVMILKGSGAPAGLPERDGPHDRRDHADPGIAQL